MTDLTNQHIAEIYDSIEMLDDKSIIELIENRASLNNLLAQADSSPCSRPYDLEYYYDNFNYVLSEELLQFNNRLRDLCVNTVKNLTDIVSRLPVDQIDTLYREIDPICKEIFELQKRFSEQFIYHDTEINCSIDTTKIKNNLKLKKLAEICSEQVITHKDKISAIIRNNPYSTRYTLAVVETIAPVIAQRYEGLDAFLIVATLTIMCRVGIDKYIDGILRDIPENQY